MLSFRARRTVGHTVRPAVCLALRETGQGMIVSSAALFGGFLVLLFSTFEAQYLMGLLLCWNIVAALLYDLLFLPAATFRLGERNS